MLIYNINSRCKYQLEHLYLGVSQTADFMVVLFSAGNWGDTGQRISRIRDKGIPPKSTSKAGVVSILGHLCNHSQLCKERNVSMLIGSQKLQQMGQENVYYLSSTNILFISVRNINIAFVPDILSWTYNIEIWACWMPRNPIMLKKNTKWHTERLCQNSRYYVIL